MNIPSVHFDRNIDQLEHTKLIDLYISCVLFIGYHLTQSIGISSYSLCSDAYYVVFVAFGIVGAHEVRSILVQLLRLGVFIVISNIKPNTKIYSVLTEQYDILLYPYNSISITVNYEQKSFIICVKWNLMERKYEMRKIHETQFLLGGSCEVLQPSKRGLLFSTTTNDDDDDEGFGSIPELAVLFLDRNIKIDVKILQFRSQVSSVTLLLIMLIICRYKWKRLYNHLNTLDAIYFWYSVQCT